MAKRGSSGKPENGGVVVQTVLGYGWYKTFSRIFWLKMNTYLLCCNMYLCSNTYLY